MVEIVWGSFSLFADNVLVGFCVVAIGMTISSIVFHLTRKGK